jgi:parallel beta-helix repeat protein
MSNDNTIELNEFTYGLAGLHTIEAHNNTIRGNTIEKNEYGLFIAKDNSIYHNTIINNTHQVYAYGGGGKWDNGFQGNYWSDYNGSDLNGDDVGDTNLPWQGVDYYPLMKPWKPILGDLNDDGVVNILDVVVIVSCYGAKPNDSSWDLLADLALPCGVIDLLDIVTLTSHYGSAWWKST